MNPSQTTDSASIPVPKADGRLEPPSGSRKLVYICFVSLVAAVGGFLFGYDIAIISGAILFLPEHFHLGPKGTGLAVSAIMLGSIVGPWLSLWLADAIGRRRTLMLAGVFYMVSAIGAALAPTFFQYVVWRIVGGLGIGLSAGVSPMYIAEISPPRLRGRMVTVNQLGITIGINIAIVVAWMLTPGGHWRWMFASEAPSVVLFMIGLMFVPYSPRWLAGRGRTAEALAVLTRINGKERAQVELQEIMSELARETGSFRELFRPGVRMALMVGIILMIFAQINGVNMMLTYAPTIMIDAGVGSKTTAMLNSVYMNIVLFIGTMVAFYTVGRFNRRPCMIAGALVIASGHLAMAYSFAHGLAPWVTLLIIFICILAFMQSLATLGWVIVSEIFPNRIRGKAVSVVMFFMFVACFVCHDLFPTITDFFIRHYKNPAGAYLLFAGICVACALFCWRFLPETKDLSLEEIGNFWLSRERHHGRTIQIHSEKDRR